MKKVYCKNCIWNKRFLEPKELCQYPNIKFFNKKTDVVPLNIALKIELNEKDNCSYYSRKWWKFWVK